MLEAAQVTSMGFLIRYFRFDSPMSRQDAYWAAGGVLLSNITVILVHGLAYYEMLKLGMRVKVATSGLLTKKVIIPLSSMSQIPKSRKMHPHFIQAFSLNNSSLRSVSVGKIVNLLSTDMSKFDFVSFYTHFVTMLNLSGKVSLAFRIFRRTSTCNSCGCGPFCSLLILCFFIILLVCAD